MKPVCSRLLVRQKDGQNGFLDVEAVLGFGEDLVGVLFKDRVEISSPRWAGRQ